MNDIQRTIFVLGATGHQGGAVVRELLKAGWCIRALVRNPRSAASAVLTEQGVDLITGSFADTEVVGQAMQGAYGVFSMLPGSLPQAEEVRLGKMIACLAAANRIEHLVYSSGASVGDKPTGIARFDAKPQIEAYIRQLSVNSTIIRPMIFMEMLVRPGYGLEEGQYRFFLRPNQAMQLIAVDDIGKFVASVFADKKRYAGKTLKIASDTVTGRELETLFSEAAGHPIKYQRYTDEFLAASPELAHMAESLEAGPLSDHVDLRLMRQINPQIISFRSWLAAEGYQAFEEAIGRRRWAR
ncbi:NmrA/HSCARG family protein [Biostraticola tofi]|uniref:Uncharacterized protein YbjT (DUF2867 family) n=1 Tax=Biostraticola tofi TaxID=466109 RepID=A0A4R3YVV4_9GAMM|nr:NmrA/HSCARG family protein [Biostraticola tofi]TCV96791.1 uncharacterized protein YbjT (DUF2867 family) [Biostraticola tofi]